MANGKWKISNGDLFFDFTHVSMILYGSARYSCYRFNKKEWSNG